MFLPRPIHPYCFHADLIWWDGSFKRKSLGLFSVRIHTPLTFKAVSYHLALNCKFFSSVGKKIAPSLLDKLTGQTSCKCFMVYWKPFCKLVGCYVPFSVGCYTPFSVSCYTPWWKDVPLWEVCIHLTFLPWYWIYKIQVKILLITTVLSELWPPHSFLKISYLISTFLIKRGLLWNKTTLVCLSYGGWISWTLPYCI